mgnify:CR=1 FL=1|tara:strand:- start:71 stop:808 length:738 start_codon:yes stop_codon:yes gene_type:complete
MYTSEVEISDKKYKKGSELDKTYKNFAVNLIKEKKVKLKVLDIGCGTGKNSLLIKKKNCIVYGVDLSVRAIEKYNKKGMNGRVADIQNGLPFGKSSFDVIFMSDVIEHIENTNFLLQEVRRVLKSEGYAIIGTTNSAFWVYRILSFFGYTLTEIQHSGHVRFFNKNLLINILNEHSFIIERFCGRNMPMIIPGWLGRFFAKYFFWIGFKLETRFTTKKEYAHLSYFTKSANKLFSDTFIIKVKLR